VSDRSAARAAARADIRDHLVRVRAEEALAVVPSFTHADAVAIGARAFGLAVERELSCVVRVMRGDQLAFHAATTGTGPDNDAWIERKIRLVRLLQISSLQARLRHDIDPTDLGWVDPVAHALHGGCIPILMAGGAVVGTITVSGLPDVDDHALALEAVLSHLDGR